MYNFNYEVILFYKLLLNIVYTGGRIFYKI